MTGGVKNVKEKYWGGGGRRGVQGITEAFLKKSWISSCLRDPAPVHSG